MRSVLSIIVLVTSIFVAHDTAVAQTTSQGLVNPETASEQQLAALPHMNATLAKAIIAKRPLKSMLDVDAALSSLTKEQRAQLYARMFRPLNLNTATREEILLIPGMGPRMAHEFEEYRPYTTIAQFRREIGKYVDREEVARLERYVSIP